MDSQVEDAMRTYAPLFQPLKDLAKNWTIDIEKCLKGFVEWMQKVQEIERSSGGHFNFAQAALVVAGGAEVYGRKVDYVHQLTLGFFEQLNEKAKKKKEGQNAGDDDGGGAVECDVPSLPDDPCEWVDLEKLRPADPQTLVLKRSACQSGKLLSYIPMELIPLMSEEKMDVPLYDSANRNVIIGMKDDFKMNTAFIHESGAMLLDLINERIINNFTAYETLADVTNVVRNLGVSETIKDVKAKEEIMEMDAGFPNDMPRIPTQCEIRRETQNPYLGTLGEHGNTTGLLLDDVDPVAGCNAADSIGNEDMGFANDVCDDDVAIAEDNRPRPHPADVEGFVDVDVEEVDIFAEYNYRMVPEKVVKCFYLASNLIQRQRKKLVQLGLEPEISFKDYLHNEVYRNAVKKGSQMLDSEFCDWPLVAVSEYINREQKRRNAIRNQLRRKQALQDDKGRYDEVELVEEADFDVVSNASDEDFFGGEAANDAPDEMRFEIIDNEDLNSNFRDVYLADANVPDASVPAGDMSYTARVRHYLDQYWAEGEEINSKVDERVQKWDEIVSPILEEEEKRRPFDIHVYGTEVLEKFQSTEETKNFCDLMEGVASYDISRYVLSSLMLANTYNLEVSYQHENIEDMGEVMERFSGDNFQLKLLKLERHHKVIEQSVTS